MTPSDDTACSVGSVWIGNKACYIPFMYAIRDFREAAILL